MTKLDDVKAAVNGCTYKAVKNVRVESCCPPNVEFEQNETLSYDPKHNGIIKEALALYQSVLEKKKVMIVPAEPSEAMCIEGVLKALDELYEFVSISNNGEGEWNETHLARYDTGETVYEHTRMTRKELEYYTQLVNKVRKALSGKGTENG